MALNLRLMSQGSPFVVLVAWQNPFFPLQITHPQVLLKYFKTYKIVHKHLITNQKSHNKSVKHIGKLKKGNRLIPKRLLSHTDPKNAGWPHKGTFNPSRTFRGQHL